jgi:LysR family transcriptional activator of nhaA
MRGSAFFKSERRISALLVAEAFICEPFLFDLRLNICLDVLHEQTEKIRKNRIARNGGPNMNRPNFNHLFAFYAVAKSGSIKNAALDLGLSSSTLSEQMKSFEAAMGEPLFTRAGRSLSLTAHGHRLFQKTESFFSGSADLLDNLGVKPNASAGFRRVEIGITTTISKLFSYELLRPLFRDKDLQIRVTESQGDVLRMEFKRQNIDIFITHEKISPSIMKRLKSVVVRQPELVVVAGKNFEKKHAPFPKGLSGQPFFLFTVRTPLRWEIEKFFKAHSISPEIRVEVDDAEILRAAAEDGLGIAILPDYSLRGSEGKLQRLGTLPKSDICIYAHYLGGEPSVEVERVMRALKESP